MKQLLWFFLFLLPLSGYAQEGSNPLLTIKRDSAAIELETLNIEIEVIANIARTTVEMTFYNPLDRVLEGELNFPLQENQTVVRFAMDVNGALREGVVVEKAKGRKTFESIVRTEVDPGLLEQTMGNNFRTRVYPLPAKGRKTVVIGYEEALSGQSKSPAYTLVMGYGMAKNFQLKVNVINQAAAPQIQENSELNFGFEQWKQAYQASYTAQDFKADKTLSFSIPNTAESRIYQEKAAEGTYFYLNYSPEVVMQQKKAPATVCLIWDHSFSGKSRDLAKELDLLDAYFKALGRVKVRLLTISNKQQPAQDYLVSNGSWDQLKEVLLKLPFDGGTQLQALDLAKAGCDEYLLFTDGLSTLGEAGKLTTTKPLYTINSNRTANHSLLRYWAEANKGRYLNLLNLDIAQATDALLTSPYQFIRATYDARKLSEVYPSLPQPVQGDFAISGIAHQKNVPITLHFGIGDQVLHSKTIVLHEQAASLKGALSRLWAAKKIAELGRHYEANKEEITRLGKKFSLITPGTSLIVLDNVEDYVRYEIVPPKELQEQYFTLLKEKQSRVKLQEKDLLEQLMEEYEERIEWWNTKYAKKGKPKPSPKKEEVAQQDNTTAPVNTTTSPATADSSATRPRLRADYNITDPPRPPATKPENFTRLIEGMVTDHTTGQGIPGVAVRIKGSTHGAVTNIDGKFMVYAPESGAQLQISFIGYETKEVELGSQAKVEVSLEEDVERLEEVVVTAIGVQRERRSLAYAVSHVVVAPEEEIAALEGKVAGVQIVQAQEGVVVRGLSSVQLGAKPLYVIDGVAVDSDEAGDLDPEEIASINVLKDDAATQMFGSRAQDGVIIIVTKEGLEDDYVLPDSIQALVEPNISLKAYNPDRPYLDEIKRLPKAQWYEAYLRLRQQYENSPSFYLDMGNLFISEGDKAAGIRILSNIAELQLENHELLRLLAQRFKQLGEMQYSLALFQRVLEIREEEPQSYRDLALAHEAAGNYQKALDLFYKVVSTEWEDDEDRFPLIRSIALYEMNHLIARHKKKLRLAHIDRSLIKPMPVDVRVVLNWSTADADMDLWVTDPYGEACWYKHKLTSIGGQLTEDYTEGYGPEEFLLKKAVPGTYKVEVDYFDDNIQKIAGPVTLQVTIYTHYGSRKEKKQEYTIQVAEEEGRITVAEFSF